MKDYDFKNILTVLKEASPAHLALASFIVFPIILNYWFEAIIKFFPDLTYCWKIAALAILIFIYIGCLIWLAIDASRKRSLELNRDLILGRLSSNKWTAMGFDSARKVLGETFEDKKIHEVIQAFPKVLRFVQLPIPDEKGLLIDDNGKSKYKPGVGLVQQKDA
jgi:hypothetical protein